MKQLEQPIYPKLSPIYNKILQLMAAIIFIIVLMNLWLFIVNKSEKTLSEHFDYTSNQHLQQAIAGIDVLLTSQPRNNKKNLQRYINKLNEIDFIKQVHLYDITGRLVMSANGGTSSSALINDLFGISENRLNKSDKYVPFVHEIRNEKLLGYLRLTIEKSYFVSTFEKENDEREMLFRLMFLLAGLVGFLLTRGLNRFSRQGYRVKRKNS